MEPIITARPKWLLDLEKSAISSLSRLDLRNRAGSEDVEVTPAFADIDDSQAIDVIEGILDTKHLTTKLREIETSNREKIGPRSISMPWASRKEAVASYFAHPEPSIDFYDLVETYSNPARLRPAGWSTVEDNLVNSSNAGLPTLTRKGNLLPLDQQELDDQQGRYPAVLYTRTAEQGKTRNVWGVPLSDIVTESAFLLPYLEYEKALPHRAALRGPNHVDKEITSIMRRNDKENGTIVSIDFSAYDASVSPEISGQAFAYIASHFQSATHDELFHIWNRFATIPLHTPDGDYGGWHGVPSGSAFTNTVDSIAQHHSAEGAYEEAQVQGDDGVYLTHQQEELYERFSLAGFTVNKDKSDTSDHDCTYLQRYYHPDYSSYDQPGVYGGVYSLHRAYNRLKYLEKFTNLDKAKITGKDYFAIRALSILENCKHHPGFEEFVRYVYDLDKYNLEYSQEGLVAFFRTQEARAKAGVLHSENPKGLNDFAVVKLIQTF